MVLLESNTYISSESDLGALGVGHGSHTVAKQVEIGLGSCVSQFAQVFLELVVHF